MGVPKITPLYAQHMRLFSTTKPDSISSSSSSESDSDSSSAEENEFGRRSLADNHFDTPKDMSVVYLKQDNQGVLGSFTNALGLSDSHSNTYGKEVEQLS